MSVTCPASTEMLTSVTTLSTQSLHVLPSLCPVPKLALAVVPEPQSTRHAPAPAQAHPDPLLRAPESPQLRSLHTCPQPDPPPGP